jgi:hypothetical protein
MILSGDTADETITIRKGLLRYGRNVMSQATVEERLAVVEAELAELKQRLNGRTASATWLDRIAGSMKDEPEFAEVLRLGRAIRDADRPAEERSES